MLSYDIIEKECDFSFDMIYYLCFYALSIQSYAHRKKVLVLNLCKITEPRKVELKVEILYDFKGFRREFFNFISFL